MLAVSNLRISAEQARTQAAYERERQRAAEAEQRFKQAREAVDLLIQVSEEELADLGTTRLALGAVAIAIGAVVLLRSRYRRLSVTK